MTSTAAFEPRRDSPFSVAIVTASYLFGGLVAGIAVGFAVSTQRTGGVVHAAQTVLAAVLALASMILASTAWARDLARRRGVIDLRRAGWAGALSFGPMVLLVGLALTLLEKIVVEQQRGPALPLHIVYGLLFIPGTFVVASGSTAILGTGLQLAPRSRTRMALATGLAAAGAYCAVYLVMELAGWRVGAPGAAERATMLVVTGLGSLAASLAGGAAIGALLRE
jgi:hypothetical protein